MSEIDRLSTSGTYPTLAIAEKRARKDRSNPEPPASVPATAPVRDESPETAPPRNPKSIIDEYA
jgi:hypothetical protein